MLTLDKVLIIAALVNVGVSNQHLLSQARTVSICIVDTRSEQAGDYDPPAGPFATGMYQQLAGRKLKDGSDHNITVFPATKQTDIMPEVHRLNCDWVLQLWYHRYVDDDVFAQPHPRGARFDSLLFTFWDGATRKVVQSGSGFVSLGGPRLTPYASFWKQIWKALNHQR